MAKTKTPFFSMGAKGTVGGALTAQKRGSATLLRSAPVPTDPYSLAQAYQRWDYKDYAYLWTLLSNTEKQLYRTRGSRQHLTGFSTWMKENLKALPSLGGRWHLDEKGGAVAYDTSRNSNNGVVTGATPVIGRIDHSLYFDGINDDIVVPHSPSISFDDDFTVEFFIRSTWHLAAGWSAIMAKGAAAPVNFRFFTNSTDKLYGEIWDGTFNPILTGPVYNDGQEHHVTLVRNTTTGRLYLYYDGLLFTDTLDTTTATLVSTQDFKAGNAGGGLWQGNLDEIILHPEALDAPTILRHSKRRYP